MLQEIQNRPHGYALKRRDHKFVVERIEGIENPAYEPDLDGDVKSNTQLTNQRNGQSKWKFLKRVEGGISDPINFIV
ncbi:uncharacterized protein LOC133845505 [Drosophila sulfurigaster albostrigata]|uniref:uncharacterized protein LOC133845505 n=1 Tax=Drosophila sulfurigaster albostrigata TaxID=89887 RepID=UPI002D218BA2|nr:uncharacterized protein LOC133845505 [Drosophila sulfurigaster albostrigata]